MTQSFNLKNKDKVELNDVHNLQVFSLEGYRYQILIKPKCAFWRIGLRFSFDNHPPGYSTNSRYNNTQIRHIEICAGVRPNGEWQNPNLLQVQQYHIPNTDSTLLSLDNYEEQSPVKLNLTLNSITKKIELELDSVVPNRVEVDAGFYQHFQLWAWADYSEFDIDIELNIALTELLVNFENIKALSGSSTQTSIIFKKLNIFFGPNNCGKTSLLVAACNPRNSFYSSVDYIGINRFFTNSEYDIEIEALDEYKKESERIQNQRKRTKNAIGQNEPFDWMVELALQSEETRSKVLDWMGQYFESWEFQELKTGKFVTGIKPTVNSLHPVEQGTGARAVLPIIIQLFNPCVNILAIDEPELGLEPRLQKLIFNAIKDATEGINGFPLKRVLLATHSHLFLDREEVRNNFSVQKLNGEVVIKQLTESIELQEATYTLLGCNPSDLFFPSNIVIVEGKSDEIFLKEIYQAGKDAGYFSSSNLVFHRLDGYEKLSHASEAIVQMLKTQAYSPVYKDRICGLFDQPKKKTKLIKNVREYFNDIKEDRFVFLDEFAIEYYYPISIINRVFGLSYTSKQYNDEIGIFLSSATHENGLKGKFNDHELTKTELAHRVASNLTKENFKEIDQSILKLLKTADRLAYR